jgi:hypothetical protein
MKVIKHSKYIWELEDFVPHSEIDYFLGMFDFYNPDLKEDFRNDLRQNDTYIATDYDDLDAMAWKWINAANKYYVDKNQWIYYNWHTEKLVNKNPNEPSMEWKGQNVIRIYNENDNYKWHGDHSPHNHSEFSYIVYLNDDFDGGRTLFLNEKIGVKPKKGTVLCFPVDHYHIHKGTKVTSGTKKILWNCVFRHEIQMTAKQSYLTATNIPRSSKRCIW